MHMHSRWKNPADQGETEQNLLEAIEHPPGVFPVTQDQAKL